MTRKNKKRNHNPHSHVRPLSVDAVERIIYGDSLPDMHTKQRLAESRKGTLIMPSLQEALQSAVQKQAKNVLHQTIADWSAEESITPSNQKENQPMSASNAFKITSNVSRDTFNFIKKNPGLMSGEIVNKLVMSGHKAASVTALISQLRRSHQVERRDDGKCYVLVDEYEPIKFKSRRHAAAKVKAKPRVAPKSAGIAALPAATAAEPVFKPFPAPVQVVSNDVEYMLNTMPIKQARDLYNELHKIFGGAK